MPVCEGRRARSAGTYAEPRCLPPASGSTRQLPIGIRRRRSRSPPRTRRSVSCPLPPPTGRAVQIRQVCSVPLAATTDADLILIGRAGVFHTPARSVRVCGGVRRQRYCSCPLNMPTIESFSAERESSSPDIDPECERHIIGVRRLPLRVRPLPRSGHPSVRRRCCFVISYPRLVLQFRAFRSVCRASPALARPSPGGLAIAPFRLR